MMRSLFFALLLIPSISLSADISISVNHDDGGKTNQRHLAKLSHALQTNNCNVKAHDNDDHAAQLIFDPAPHSKVRGSYSDYQLLAIAKTLNGDTQVRGAIVVQASTGITDLNTLKGSWFAFISENSWIGYKLPLNLLSQVGINENNSQFYFVGNYIGSAAALGHRDVQVAILAEPLARRWAKVNNLAIVALTDAVETGAWWIHKNTPEDVIQQCRDALLQLNKSQHKVLPAWIDGFASYP
jgi:hypothetical protein